MIEPLAPWEIVGASSGELVEGPRWVPERECFQWVDILGSAIFRWNPYTGRCAERRSLDLEYAATAEPLDADRSVVASRDSLHLYNWQTGQLSLLGQWTFDENVRFNDSGRSPDGQLYFGTMSMVGDPDRGSLYRWSGGDQLHQVVENVGISNGLGWLSTDRAYYVDSMVSGLFMLDFGGETISRSRLAQFAEGDEPDGLAITPETNALVAMWEGGRLLEVSPTGRIVAEIPVPANSPTSVCFGGREEEQVIVTTARTESAQSDADGAVLASRWDALVAERLLMGAT